MGARFGAWAPARCSFLLAQAMRRNHLATKHGGEGSLSPAAAALWLHAIATAGLSLDSATEKVEVEAILLSCAESLALTDTELSENADGAGPESVARALCALRLLGKDEERGLGEALLAHLANHDAHTFTAPTWLLLGEVRSSFSTADIEPPEIFSSELWLSALGALPTAAAEETSAVEKE